MCRTSPARRFLDLYKIPAGSAHAYALTSEDFAALAKELRPARRPRPHRDRR